MTSIPLSLQMYSLRDDAQNDFAATVAEVARMGFAGVELAGYGNLDATAAARALQDAGLKCSGMHVGLERLRANPVQVAAEARLFATREVICPWFPPALLDTREAFLGLGAELDAIGGQLRSYGVQLHYHNHDAEWRVFDGRPGLDWLLDAARPAHLLCEPDVYWIKVGGGDPARFLREQGRRVRLLHLKDEKEIGTGPVDFAALYAALKELDTVAWAVVEVEHYNHSPIESVRQSFAQLQTWGFA
jgi:sugar phosphate isomerase/epimerase